MSSSEKEKKNEHPTLENLEKLLPAFDFLSIIDQEGVGSVYHANQTSLERDVAVKVLPEVYAENKRFRTNFRIQAQAMAKLSHPNLVAIYDFGELRKMLYIVMEFVDGRTLYDLTAEGRVDHLEVASVASKIAKGLYAAHESEITHRNLTPKNILLTKKNLPKIRDFGISDIQTNKDDEDSFESSGYCAPEVIKDIEAAGVQSDIFSLGVIIYEMLTLCLPAKKYAAACDLVDAHEDFDNIIRKAIHPNLSMRYKTAETLMKDLEDLYQTVEAETKQRSSRVSPFLTTSTTSIPRSKSGSSTLRSTESESGSVNLRTPVTGAHNLRSAHTSAATEARATTSNVFNTAATTQPTHQTASVQPISNTPKVYVPNKKKQNIIINFFIVLVLCIAGYGAYLFVDEQNKKHARPKAKDQSQSGVNTPVTNPNNQNGSDSSSGFDEDFGSSSSDIAISDKDIVLADRKGLELGQKERTSHEEALKQLQAEQLNLLNSVINVEGLPNNTFSRHESFYLYINKEMTWHEADTFASTFGGQIATCSQLADLAYIKKFADEGETFWLGGGSTPGNKIEYIDDIPFKINVSGIYQGRALCYSGGNEASLADPKEKFTFFLQWDVKGKRNSSVDSRLLRLTSTLAAKDPKYPPLSYSSTGHTFAVIQKPMTFQEAKQLARYAGGHLAVISEGKEHDILSKYLATTLGSEDRIWIGYEPSDDGSWVTVTSEKKALKPWIGLTPPASKYAAACAISNDIAKIVPANEEILNGCVIEWSDDEETANQLLFVYESKDSLEEVKQQAQEMVKFQLSWFNYHSSNIPKQMIWILNTRRNAGLKTERESLGPKLDKYIDEIETLGGIPEMFNVESLPRDIRDPAYIVLDKQTVIHAKHKKQLKIIRDGYIYQLKRLFESYKDTKDPAAIAIKNEALRIRSKANEFTTLIFE